MAAAFLQLVSRWVKIFPSSFRTYFNFAVALNDVKLVYNKGPYKSSWLKFVGMGNVGFRTPIYKITADEVK